MKKIYFLAAVAAAVLTACVKESSTQEPIEQAPQTVHFTAGSIETKTHFDDPTGSTYPVLWSGNEEVAINLNLSTAAADNKTVSVVASSDHKTATFSADFTAGTSHQFIVVSPAAALRGEKASDQTVSLLIPSAQSSTATSPDPKAQVMAGLSSKTTELPPSVSLTLRHIPAYLHLTFTNADLNGGVVKAVNVTSSKDIAGRFYFGADYNMKSAIAGVKSITISTESLDNVWCALLPVDLSISNLTFEIITDKGSLSKVVSIGAEHEMQRGKIYKMTVDMAGVVMAAPQEYTKVTDVSQLHYADQIIIASAEDGTALSIAQTTNNRSGAGVCIINGGNTILNPSADVEIIRLEDGTVPGLFAFKATKNEGYLYAANVSGSNSLRTNKTVLDDSGSWDITIANTENPNHFVDLAANVSWRNLLRYNSADKLFAAYGGSTTQKKVCIFRKNGAADNSPRFKATMPANGTTVSGSAAILPVYVFGNVAWTASVTGAGASLDKISGTGYDTLTLTLEENPSGTESRSITVTVTTTASVTPNSYELTFTQAAKPVPASFPIVWSMPAISSSWQSGVDYDCSSYTNPWIYADDHTGRLTLNRFGTNPTNAPNYQYNNPATSSEVIVGGRMYSCGVYEGDYWLFDIYNVQNPAGTYNISYKTCSTNAGPRYFLLQYSVDGGSNWVNINPITEAVKYKDGSSYNGGKEVTYTYTTSTAPSYANNELRNVNESFHINAISTMKTLKIRAIVACKMKNDGSADMSSNHHGGAHRLGGNVTITFTAD